jgi:ABC-2 type transport system permease protein
MFLGQIAARFVWLVVAFAAAGTDSLRPLVIAAIAVYVTAGLAGILTRLIEAGEAAWMASRRWRPPRSAPPSAGRR